MLRDLQLRSTQFCIFSCNTANLLRINDLKLFRKIFCPDKKSSLSSHRDNEHGDIGGEEYLVGKRRVEQPGEYILFLVRHHDKVESRAFFEGVEIFHGFVERQRGSVEHEIAEVGLTVCFKPCKSLIGPALEGPLLSGDVRYRYFGIGIGEQNPGARDPLKWKGQNLLGFALTQARDMLAGPE